MAAIRPESEVDRTEAALAADGLGLPLPDGTVEVSVAPRVLASSGGQRLTTLLINELARMKGVVSTIYLATDEDPVVRPETPLPPQSYHHAIAQLVEGLNATGSAYSASIRLQDAENPAVRVYVGEHQGPADLTVACDAWRALFGRYTTEADWNAASPIGAAMAAALTAAEEFKRLVDAYRPTQSTRLAPVDFAYSALNYGTNSDAASGPDPTNLQISDTAIVGCGAGGSGTAYILGMHPNVHGQLALIEPGRHKLSNLNRYLATTAADVHAERHKISSLVNHLAPFAPRLELELHPRPWEQLDQHPWGHLVSAVDTVEARWEIQRRSTQDASIIDLAVDDLLYAVLAVRRGGRCLFCKHPYDPELAVKQRAARWGVPLNTIEEWTYEDRLVDNAMLTTLARTQGREAEDFADLLDVPFTDTPRLTECGSTPLQADVPSQAPVLPVATTAVAVVGAAEVIKLHAGIDGVDNFLAHDLRRSPTDPWAKHKSPRRSCPHHGS